MKIRRRGESNRATEACEIGAHSFGALVFGLWSSPTRGIRRVWMWAQVVPIPNKQKPVTIIIILNNK